MLGNSNVGRFRTLQTRTGLPLRVWAILQLVIQEMVVVEVL